MIKVAPTEYLEKMPLHFIDETISQKKQGNPKVPLSLMPVRAMK
jgi:hypothetical protein